MVKFYVCYQSITQCIITCFRYAKYDHCFRKMSKYKRVNQNEFMYVKVIKIWQKCPKYELKNSKAEQFIPKYLSLSCLKVNKNNKAPINDALVRLGDCKAYEKTKTSKNLL